MADHGPIFQDARPQPFTDQADDAVADPVLRETDDPLAADPRTGSQKQVSRRLIGAVSFDAVLGHVLGNSHKRFGQYFRIEYGMGIDRFGMKIGTVLAFLDI